MNAAAQVCAAEVIHAPHASRHHSPPALLLLLFLLFLPFLLRRVSCSRSFPLAPQGGPDGAAGVEKLEARQHIQGSEELPDAHISPVHGLHALRAVQHLKTQNSERGGRATTEISFIVGKGALLLVTHPKIQRARVRQGIPSRSLDK